MLLSAKFGHRSGHIFSGGAISGHAAVHASGHASGHVFFDSSFDPETRTEAPKMRRRATAENTVLRNAIVRNVIVRNVIVRNAIVRNAIVRNATVGDAILRKFVIQSMVLGLVFMGLLSLAAGAAGPGNPAIQQFEADPGMAEAGNGSLLKWNVSGCAFVLIEPGSYLVQAYGYGNEYGDGALAPGEREIGLQGSMLVFPDKTTSYTLVAGNSEGNSTASTSVIVSASGVAKPANTPETANNPVISYFGASPSSVTLGAGTTLSWSVSNAAEVTISGVGKTSLSGSIAVMPSKSTTYVLTARNAQGESTASASVTVIKPQVSKPSITYFSAQPTRLMSGERAILSWSTSGSGSYNVVIDPDIGIVNPTGTISVSPSKTTVFTLRASNPAGAVTASARVDVIQRVMPPVIGYFSSDKGSISRGDTANLAWSVSGADGVTISPGIGWVGPSGSVSVKPYTSTSYTLTASNSGGTATRSIFIEVGDVSIQPIDPISMYPDMPNI